jgi:hypothetical protein
MNFQSLKQSKLSQTKKGFFLNSRAIGPKSARGPGRQRPSRPGSCGARPARCGQAACSRGPHASEAGPGAAPTCHLERAGEPVRLARHPAVHAHRSTVAQPTASTQWPNDGKVLPHGIVAIPRTSPARKCRQ